MPEDGQLVVKADEIPRPFNGALPRAGYVNVWTGPLI
ncbi:hypothetical protein HNP02_007511 [Mycobacterium sp. AZCC_0083]|nr:hypothetical protein [Mycobacterium sp. AZCC_0083]